MRCVKIPYGEAAIVQKYLAKPLLFDGYKFDLRLYVLVTSFSPLEVFIYKEGFGRFASRPYDVESATLADTYIHLTNSSIQKHTSV